MKLIVINGKRMKYVLAALAVSLILVFAFTYTGGIGRFVSVMKSGVDPYYSADTKEKEVALTFDAVWTDYNLENLLQILKEYEVKATFFCSGRWIEKYPEGFKRILEEGHEIGNSTYNHSHLTDIPKLNIMTEIKGGEEMIEKSSGKRSVLFRPPFGSYSADVLSVADGMGYDTILWDVDSKDWTEHDPDNIVKNVEKNVKKGSILLFHVDGPKTAEALPAVIKVLEKEKLAIVPVTDLLGIKQN